MVVFLQTYTKFAEQRLEFSHFNGSIIPEDEGLYHLGAFHECWNNPCIQLWDKWALSLQIVITALLLSRCTIGLDIVTLHWIIVFK